MMECSRHILRTTCFPISLKDTTTDFEEPNSNKGIRMDETTFTLVDSSANNAFAAVTPKKCICTKIPEPCLHYLAKTGELAKLKNMFSLIFNNEDILKIDNRKRTILHYAANYKGNLEKARACVDLIINEIHSRDIPDTEFINTKDELGLTALYLGVKTENLDVCESLIRAGADWDLQCNRQKSPIQKMFKKIPHIIATHFLQKAEKSVTYSNSEASEVLIDFGVFIGYPSDEDIKLNKLNLYEETDFLSNLCYTPVNKREEILSHPLIQTYIHMKWQKIKFFFWLSRIFQTVWAMVYFWFLIEVYRRLCPYPSSEQFEFTWFLIHNHEKILGINISDPTSSDELKSCRSHEWIIICSYILLLIATLDLMYFEVHPTYIRFQRYWYPMKTVNLRKLYKRVLLFFRLIQIDKMLLLFTIYLNVLPLLLIPIYDPLADWQYLSASIGVFLTWLHIFNQIGKIPKFAVYVKMLEKVLSTLGVITLIYISLIFAFGMVFCILLPGVPSYSSPFQAILKMSTFLIGEVEYEKFFYEENSKHISVSLSVSMFFYGIAIIVLHVALLNFLIGLTVTDVQNIEKYTEVWRSYCHIWQISLFESFLSRCPFRFGLPWLKRISITSFKFPKQINVENRHDNQTLGSTESFDMTVPVRLKDLPKRLTKEIRNMIHKNENIQTEANKII